MNNYVEEHIICISLGNPRYFVIREGALKCIDKLTLALQSMYY